MKLHRTPMLKSVFLFSLCFAFAVSTCIAQSQPIITKDITSNGFFVKIAPESLTDANTAMETSWYVADWYVTNHDPYQIMGTLSQVEQTIDPVKEAIQYIRAVGGDASALLSIIIDKTAQTTMDVIDIFNPSTAPRVIQDANRELAPCINPLNMDPLGGDFGCLTSPTHIMTAAKLFFFYEFHDQFLKAIKATAFYRGSNEYLEIHGSGGWPIHWSYQLQPAKPNLQQFRVTSGMYSETVNLDQAVKSEFGNDYRVADWTDITAHSSDIQNWANSIGMNHNDYYFITWNGQGFWNSGNRHYFITRFDGQIDNNYLVHDQIGGNIITLGSWYGIQERILAIRNAPIQQQQNAVKIFGSIYNVETNTPIAGATIAATDNLGNTLNVITDSNGYYQLSLSKTAKYELVIFAPGYINNYAHGVSATEDINVGFGLKPATGLVL
jgi:hypothetical protein